MSLLYQQDLFSSMPFPARPLCSDDLSNGLWRAKLDDALKLPYIQANPQRLIWVLLFDVDRPLATLSWEDSNLPPPTWTTMNPDNGHAHLAYALSAPVAKSDAARLKPLRLLARVQHAMTTILEADRGYIGLITKTPNHGRWITNVWRSTPYELDELRDWLPDDLPLPKTIKKTELLGYGRNVSLFDSLRKWSYRHFRDYKNYRKWISACLDHANHINTFTTPLPLNEIKSIAKSVANWTWRNFDVAESDARFSKLQAHRGRLGGRISAERTNSTRKAQLMHIQEELLR